MGDSASRFASLRALADLVDAPPAFERFAPTVADVVAELLDADGVWVCVRRRRHGDLVMRHARGITPRETVSGDLPIAADPLVELAVLARRQLFVLDYHDEDVSDPALRAQGVTSVAAAPVVAGQRELGALIAFRTAHRQFGEPDADLLAQAASTLALVLTTQEARRQHARAVARERVLAAATYQTAAAPALEQAMACTAAGAAEVADAAFAAVVLETACGPRIVASTPGDVNELVRSCVPSGLECHPLQPLGSVATAEALRDARPLVFVDAVGLCRRLGVPVADHPLVRGRLVVVLPITDQHETHGAILVMLDHESPDPAVFGSLETLAGHAAGVVRRARLHGEVQQAYLATVTALANALEAKDASTQEHAGETSRLAVAVGEHLGLEPDALRDLEFAAVLHDVGKIAIPDEVLNRRGPLSDQEWGFVRDHTKIGERILRGIPFLQSAAASVRSAHERWDGEGYPDGLAGEQIPLLSRIVFACDTWDVMTSDRPYRAALGATEARRRLVAEAGAQLDPQVVDALLAVLDAHTAVRTPHKARTAA
jgi:HD-GYP domain-containing protein (c-di-GMP phosphodiesterase class II)